MLFKTMSIEDPTNAENVSFFFTDKAITVIQVNDVVQGTTPSLTRNVKHATARDTGSSNDLFSADRTTTSESGAETASFSGGDATIPGGSWVWLESSAKSGTVDEFGISVRYTID